MKLITKRLELVPLTKKDTELLYQLIKEDNKEISQWTTVPFPYKKTDIADFYKKAKEDKTKVIFVIKNKDTKEIMGTIAPEKNVKDNSVIIGFWLGKQFRDKGYMTEAVQRILNFLFQTMNILRVEITAHEDNIPSQKVIKKSGFIYEGTLRMGAYNGLKQYADLRIYSILRKEWEKKKRKTKRKK